ncbi:hypothetical protein FA95DRAFT_1505255 [Auriscalpium vulgare]|uniref:Uncharacterized protein n=1 Tax=Auriscalpium vulgare TaxID=40419 RepID=A0ACB8R3P0_9AGAM|nr:hypothetical protein FA95DRAFT_1505255 [Auriscalpium vulgare]
MPARKLRTAPVFDPEKPREIRRYWEDLEPALAQAGITGNREKKDWSKLYVPSAEAGMFDSMPEFTGNGTYEEFKTVVGKLYLGAEEDQAYTLADLESLVLKTRNKKELTLDDFAVFHREYLTISGFLVRKGRLSTMQQNREFSRGIPDRIWLSLNPRLQIKKPDVEPGEAYKIADVYQAGKFVLALATDTFRNVGHVAAVNVPIPVVTVTSPSPPPSIKTEDILMQIVCTLMQGGNPLQSVAATSASAAPATTPTATAAALDAKSAAMTRLAGRCLYCGSSDHRRQASCPVDD